MKKLLKIRSTNRSIIFKDRVVRAPVEIQVTDEEFKKLETQLRLKGITKDEYTLESIKVESKKSTYETPQETVEKDFVDDDPEIEELEDQEHQSILERLANSE